MDYKFLLYQLIVAVRLKTVDRFFFKIIYNDDDMILSKVLFT